MRGPDGQPMAVYREGGTWRWLCRRCHRSDWCPTHRGAIAEADSHLAAHRSFGFQAKR